MKDKIAFIYTGGTIGSSVVRFQKELKRDLDIKAVRDRIEKRIPLVKNKIDSIWKKPTNKFSERFIAEDWKLVAKKLDEAIREGASGAVVLHGTDTMSYTSAALSYMLQGVKIPIVLTGANYPLMEENSDAVRNISDAIFVAQQHNWKGVFLVFSGDPKMSSTVHLGTRVRKTRFTRNCYTSINAKPIGKVQRNIITRKPFIQYTNLELLNHVTSVNMSKEYFLKENVCDNVFLFKVHPSFRARQLSECQARGIILELYNSGTGCDIGHRNYSLVPNIKEQDVPIFITSQQVGTVDMEIYQSSINIREAGAIPLKDMTTETAVAKLMWVLGQTQKKKEVVELMLRNLVGEIS